MARKTILISSHILPEIDLLADDIGIIHEGKLLEESSMDELRKKNQKYVLFRVSSTGTAARILEQKCGGVNYRIEDDNVMRVYDTDIDLSRINQEFITNNIGVYESRVCGEKMAIQTCLCRHLQKKPVKIKPISLKNEDILQDAGKNKR